MRQETMDDAMKKRSQSATAWRRLLATLALLLVMLLSSVALGQDKDVLFKMKEQKLPDETIVSIIKDSGPLNLTAEDVEKLKGLGAGDVLLKFLEDNGHILVAANPGGGGLDPAPGDGLDPAEADPDELAAEDARKKAEDEARIRAEAEKLRQEEEARKAKEAEINRLIARLTEAERLQRRGSNMQAAAICLEFLSNEPDPESDEWYRARFILAQALFAEGIYSGAAGPTLDVLMKGPEKPNFVDAFYMLRTLTRENNYEPPQLEDLTKFYIENLEQEFQDDFNFYMGRFFYDYNKPELAFKYLERVSEGSPDKAAALYLTGVAQIDPEVRKYRSAVQSFQNAILAAESNKDTDPEILELAYLALARVAYEATNYDGALYYYAKIPRLSPRRSTSLFEASWTYFLKNDYNRAMGAFHSLHSTYYDQWYYPDLYILEATVYLNLCKFGLAKESLVVFKARYLDQQPLLQNFLEGTVEPQAYYDALVTIYDKRGTGEDAGLPMIFAQGVFNNVDFRNSYRVIDNLTKEKAALEANLDRLGDFGSEVLERVDTALKTQLVDAGIKVQQILTSMDQELTDWSIKADEIDFEIDGARADEAKRALLNPDYVAPTALEGTTLFVVADDWQFWPFEGEYWVDEIGNYRSFLATECIEQ